MAECDDINSGSAVVLWPKKNRGRFKGKREKSKGTKGTRGEISLEVRGDSQ